MWKAMLRGELVGSSLKLQNSANQYNAIVFLVKLSICQNIGIYSEKRLFMNVMFSSNYNAENINKVRGNPSLAKICLWLTETG